MKYNLQKKKIIHSLQNPNSKPKPKTQLKTPTGWGAGQPAGFPAFFLKKRTTKR
jgi:hypothetical protein